MKACSSGEVAHDHLPNGKSIDLDILETAMEDSDLGNRYFLNLVKGEVVFFSDDLGLSDEDERLLEEIDGSNDYVAVERIPSHKPTSGWSISWTKWSLPPTNMPPSNYLWHYTAKGRFAALKRRYTASMSNGCKHGISGETSGSKLLSVSGSRVFSSSQSGVIIPITLQYVRPIKLQ